ncbi:PucR family transcriptional regulator [Streptomyces venezuelae]|uniref:PucR family transcriptional regulator n=1 Tax=Streptomyces venezuelae TaxID=54571 RepID=A0A5P2DFL8_STRVZ|nr:helix-turn-helix domain-containing protein [Streptomyces venezuelae]QES51789.1 PucR family transcriptional regulator [Streptomyces venezuelae]
MCELLNRIWSRPRGEWTRVLRRELPTLAAEIVEELLHGTPGFSVFAEDVDDELLRHAVELALVGVLGYRSREHGHHEVDVHGHHEVDVHGHHEVDVHGHHEDEVRGHHEAPLDRARQGLFKALTRDRSPAEDTVAELARQAAWPVPEAVRAIALTSPGETQQLAGMLDDGLAGMAGGQPCLLVPSHDGDTRTPLENVLRGRLAAVGHPVPLRDTASSLRWALRLLALTPPRPGPDTRAVFVDDHLSTLLLLQDEPLAHALAARRLQPLADLTPRQSERLEVTLLAWLEGGGAPEAAKALNVHPQTVRYRMRQLEKLFGSDLRDPGTRFELEMALRSRRLMAQRRQSSRTGRRGRPPLAAEFRPLGIGRMARVNGL